MGVTVSLSMLEFLTKADVQDQMGAALVLLNRWRTDEEIDAMIAAFHRLRAQGMPPTSVIVVMHQIQRRRKGPFVDIVPFPWYLDKHRNGLIRDNYIFLLICGLHRRLGAASALRRAFVCHPLAETGLLRCVVEYLV